MTTLRSDAVRNRTAILEAAAHVFRSHGTGAPLSLVVSASGVGRGTLYRHFADREALVSALYSARVDELETLSAEHQGPDLLDRLLTEMWWMHQDSPGVFTVMDSSTTQRATMNDIGTRVHDLIRHAVRVAHCAGRLRADVDEDVVIQLLAMLPASTRRDGGVETGRTVLDVLLRGIRMENLPESGHEVTSTPRPMEPPSTSSAP